MEYVVTLWTTPATLLVAAVIALITEYSLSAASYGLNSGQLGRGKWWVLECLWEDLLENVPGGHARKVAKLKEMASYGDGIFIGSTRSWRHDELKMRGDWEACARDVFGTPLRFWIGTTATMLLAACAGTMAAHLFAHMFL